MELYVDGGGMRWFADRRDDDSANARVWGKPPEWLAAFQGMRATLLWPLPELMGECYAVQQADCERVAECGDRDATLLRAAAQGFEQADSAGAAAIIRAL
ncbi:hypothetical protein [Nocardia iowensis]|uniref:Uncharacterized protein n=1 Tax=Nocardia iowensis TaxID=204891 RepID=A0ABX8RYP3_NOCIO|nr:hypothetical protein [Nocardia iowensis]QXN94663.1 hypothetical protein KV110_17375 [Nocardia iowensis]